MLTAIGAYILGMSNMSAGRPPIDDVKLLSLMKLDNSAVATKLAGRKMDKTQEKRRAGSFPVEIVGHRLVPVGMTEEKGFEGDVRQGLLPKFEEEKDDGF